MVCGLSVCSVCKDLGSLTWSVVLVCVLCAKTWDL